MRTKLGLRVTVALFLAVLLPLESGQCAFLMPFRAAAASVAVEHRPSGPHDCCEGTPATSRGSESGRSCCEYTPLPATLASVAGSHPVPVALGLAHALPPAAMTAAGAPAARLGRGPDARTDAPTDAAVAARSPRGPPHSV